MEEILNGVEKIIALIERLSKLQLLTLAIILMSALLVFLLDKIPFINGKLSDMNTLYTIAILIIYFTSSILIVRITAVIMKYCDVKFFKYSKRRVQEIIKNVLLEIKTFTPDELALLKYVYDTGRSAVYIPIKDSAALTLWNKGYLRQVVNSYFPRVHGKGGRFTTTCYLFDLQNNLRALIKTYYNAIDWKDYPAPDYDKYQKTQKSPGVIRGKKLS